MAKTTLGASCESQLASPHWTQFLVDLRACSKAIEWVRTQPDLKTAWQRCERADWMLWLASKFSGPPWSEGRKPLVLAACECAETAIEFIRDEGRRGIAQAAIRNARAWAYGKATEEDVRMAGDAAIYAAAYAAHAAVLAANAAANAAADADAAADRAASLRTMADIVRRHYPTAASLKGGA